MFQNMATNDEISASVLVRGSEIRRYDFDAAASRGRRLATGKAWFKADRGVLSLFGEKRQKLRSAGADFDNPFTMKVMAFDKFAGQVLRILTKNGGSVQRIVVVTFFIIHQLRVECSVEEMRASVAEAHVEITT